VINADVLDAWFPPSPQVTSVIAENLPWLLRTSPPTDGAGLARAVAAARGVAPRHILLGGGSSDLIFRAFLHWLRPESRVVLIDPTYGEYAHVVEKVVRCQVRKVALRRDDGFRVSLPDLERVLAEGCDLLVLVNPNSPTGQHVGRAEMEAFLRRVPAATRVWVDETYVDYVSSQESIERWAAQSPNVIVCKSMSKVYALSGARVAYLCAAPHQLESLRAITPPWVVGLPAQAAAVHALQDPAYYAARYDETRQLREELRRELHALGLEVLPGCANFLLAFLPDTGPRAAEVVARCRRHGLFLRDAGRTSEVLGPHTLRLAVKDAATNLRQIEILRNALAGQ
jgi:histidinol-phosphate/aromatic aminotransferase/cobyric acid decarboxylase-like protein